MPRALRFSIVTVFFLVALSTRLLWLHLYSLDLPFWDQWNAEGWNWFRAFELDGFDAAMLFSLHNEHRIAASRLASLLLFLANDRQWDNLVVACFNAILVAAMAGAAFAAVMRHARALAWPLGLFLLAAVCLPCGHENLLIGFQNAFYFLIGLTVLGTWLAATRPLVPRTIIGLGAIAFASVFTLGSGLFTGATMAVALILRQRQQPEPGRALLAALIVVLSAVVLGACLMPHIDGRPPTYAQDPRDLLDAVAWVMSWPLGAHWVCAIVLWLPFALGAWRWLCRRGTHWHAACALALGGWTLIQIAGTAYSRGHQMSFVSSRYTDILLIGVLVNVYFCTSLALDAARRRPWRGPVIAGVWITLVFAGLLQQGWAAVAEMQRFRPLRQAQVDNVRRYVAGADTTAFDGQPQMTVPFPNVTYLRQFLDDATIRAMLPASVRPPLVLAVPSGAFVAPGYYPSVAALPQADSVGSFHPRFGNPNVGEMLESDLHSRFPYLRIPVVGYLGQPELLLELLSADRRERIAVMPPELAHETWTQVEVAVPGADFALHARDGNPDYWFAFADAAEVGTLSHWTGAWLQRAPAFACLAWLLAFFLLQLSLWPGRKVEAGSA